MDIASVMMDGVLAMKDEGSVMMGNVLEKRGSGGVGRLFFRRGLVLVLLLWTCMQVMAADICGRVLDADTREPLMGAYVLVDGTEKGAVTDVEGRFKISGLKKGQRYVLVVKYVSYLDLRVEAKALGQAEELVVEMRTDEKSLGEVQVTGVARHNTEVGMLRLQRESQVIQSNVSAQEIQRTQDSNAGEVIRRVPGVSLIDEKFVMVRGLSQRYNNVWINGGAAPSSEADSRAFSFDLIPSAQIENLQIMKTPSAEYPADYTGGFIAISTKDIPAENSLELSLGGGWNSEASFSRFLYGKGSGTDFLGFDGGLRSLSGGIDVSLASLANGTSLTGNGLNNDWRVRSMHPAGDLKWTASLGRRWTMGGCRAGLVAALNYTNEYRSYGDMPNNLFGVYDAERDESNYLHRYTDDQYNHNVRLGAMLNLTLLSRNGNNKYQWKNIFNQIGNDRYTWREGISAQSDTEHQAEYYYRSRTTYNGQFTGKHTLMDDVLDWSLSYSYANRNLPDRRRYLVNNSLDPDLMQLTVGNDVSREWTRLDEHIMSATVNDHHDFRFGNWSPSLKFGAYGEYRTRKYRTRNFIYNWNVSDNTMPEGFRSMDMTELLSNSDYFGEDRLYLLEEVQMRNHYDGDNALGAAYLSATLPLGRLSLLAGLRYEYTHMVLTVNTRDYEESPFDHKYDYNDLFPSLNATYRLDEKQQLRLSYGKTVNRPEFREVSPAVFYDFDLASNVQGNTSLKPCYIQNFDVRYEFYPSQGEIISLAAFYKYFDSPIEWTYTVTGGTGLVYSYLNARSARSYGLELDVRKNFDFIGLKDFGISFNGALIKSKVEFEEGSKEENRPMQGQSPYLINAGLFYKNERVQLDVAVLYNRIGKRIIGVGRSEGTTSGHETLRVPDSYEMPRDVIDLSASKRFGSHWEVKMQVKDLLSQKVYYKQFADVTYSDGSYRKVGQTTRSFRPGRNLGITAVYRF